MGSVRRDQGLPQAGRSMDPPQDIAEPISDAGGTSEKTHLRQDKTLPGSVQNVV